MRNYAFFCLLVHLTYSIHIPGENVGKKTLTTAGINTTNWKTNSQPQIAIHHNYSKVSVQSPEEPPNPHQFRHDGNDFEQEQQHYYPSESFQGQKQQDLDLDDFDQVAENEGFILGSSNSQPQHPQQAKMDGFDNSGFEQTSPNRQSYPGKKPDDFYQTGQQKNHGMGAANFNQGQAPLGQRQEDFDLEDFGQSFDNSGFYQSSTNFIPPGREQQQLQENDPLRGQKQDGFDQKHAFDMRTGNSKFDQNQLNYEPPQGLKQQVPTLEEVLQMVSGHQSSFQDQKLNHFDSDDFYQTPRQSNDNLSGGKVILDQHQSNYQTAHGQKQQSFDSDDFERPFDNSGFAQSTKPHHGQKQTDFALDDFYQASGQNDGTIERNQFNQKPQGQGSVDEMIAAVFGLNSTTSKPPYNLFPGQKPDNLDSHQSGGKIHQNEFNAQQSQDQNQQQRTLDDIIAEVFGQNSTTSKPPYNLFQGQKPDNLDSHQSGGKIDQNEFNAQQSQDQNQQQRTLDDIIAEVFGLNSTTSKPQHYPDEKKNQQGYSLDEMITDVFGQNSTKPQQGQSHLSQGQKQQQFGAEDRGYTIDISASDTISKSNQAQQNDAFFSQKQNDLDTAASFKHNQYSWSQGQKNDEFGQANIVNPSSSKSQEETQTPKSFPSFQRLKPGKVNKTSGSGKQTYQFHGSKLTDIMETETKQNKERESTNLYGFDERSFGDGFKNSLNPQNSYTSKHQEAGGSYYGGGRTKCPTMATGWFAYAESCNQFLNCWKGRSFIENCAPGTLFNPQTRECDYASKVKCLPKQDNPKLAKQVVKINCPSGFSGVVPHQSDCSKFLNCANGIEHVMDCPPGTLFSLKINNCDFPRNTECASWSSKFGNVKDFDHSDIEYSASNQHSRQEVWWNQNSNQQKYSGFVDAQNHLQQGASGYDHSGYVEETTINYQHNFDSEENNRGGEENNDHLIKCPGHTSGFYPHPFVCTKFVNCVNGQTIIQDCAPGTAYNLEINACDAAQNVNCDHIKYFKDAIQEESFITKTTQIGSTSANNNRGVVECPYGESGLFPHPKICSKFLNCANGQTFIQDCAPGTLFNPALKICDFPHKVECESNFGELIDVRFLLESSYPTNAKKDTEDGHQQKFPTFTDHQTSFNSHGDRNELSQGQTGSATHNSGSVWINRNDPTGTNSNPVHQGISSSTNQGHGSVWTHTGQWRFGEEGQGSSLTPPVDSHTNQNTGSVWNGRNDHQGQSQGFSGNTNQGYGSAWTQTGQGRFGEEAQGSSVTQQHIRPPHIGSNVNQNTGPVWNDRNDLGTNTNSMHQGQSGFSGSSNQGHGSAWTQKNQGDFGEEGQGSSVTQQHIRPPPIGSNTNQNTGPVWNERNDLEANTNSMHQGQSSFSGSTYQGHGSAWTGQGRFGEGQGSSLTPQHVNPPLPDSNGNQNAGSVWVNKNDLGVNTNPTSGNTNQGHGSVWTGQERFGEGQGGSLTPHHIKLHEGATLEVGSLGNQNPKTVCDSFDFYCSFDQCVSQSRVCDGVEDCPNGRDEKDCRQKYLNEVTLISDSILAVREKEKYFNFSVVYCAKTCLESKGFWCKSFSYRKDDGACFLNDVNIGESGALISSDPYDYYEVKKLTLNCSNRYICPNQKCIEYKEVCDGINNCADRSDEKGCNAEEFGYQIRLGGTDKKYEGRIEIKAFGKWGHICDDKFGLRDAEVVCKELGFPLGALEVKGNSYYAHDLDEKDVFYLMDDVGCLGNESTLRDCDFNGWGVHNCELQEVVGVVCKTPLENCPKDYWKCDSSEECVPLSFVCDGVFDCNDQSDEAEKYCEAPTEIRLVNGISKYEGRVEVKYHGIWGTVCDDDFNDDSAKVVCKQLGYPGGASSKKDGHFGAGDGPIWLDQVFCQGNESSIEHCVHWNWGEHNCEHSEDVGVICNNSQGTERNVKLEDRIKKDDVEIEDVFPGRCGLRKNDPYYDNNGIDFRVIKGNLAKVGDYPWQASLRIKTKLKPTYWCGAVVISQKFVLTAAHCLVGYSKGAYFVVAGDYDTDNAEGTEQEGFIEEFYIHEEFRSGQKMNNDIALVKVKGVGFNFTKDIQPICLPAQDFQYEKDLNCTISGFGSIESGKSGYSHNLRAGWVPLQPREVCQMPHVYGSSITDGMICAGSLDEGVDACDGDSGGPLACLDKGHFTLYGLTSWGQHCGHANKPGVYVKVSHYRKWIDDTMKDNL